MKIMHVVSDANIAECTRTLERLRTAIGDMGHEIVIIPAPVIRSNLSKMMMIYDENLAPTHATPKQHGPIRKGKGGKVRKW